MIDRLVHGPPNKNMHFAAPKDGGGGPAKKDIQPPRITEIRIGKEKPSETSFKIASGHAYGVGRVDANQSLQNIQRGYDTIAVSRSDGSACTTLSADQLRLQVVHDADTQSPFFHVMNSGRNDAIVYNRGHEERGLPELDDLHRLPGRQSLQESSGKQHPDTRYGTSDFANTVILVPIGSESVMVLEVNGSGGGTDAAGRKTETISFKAYEEPAGVRYVPLQQRAIAREARTK